MTIYRSINTQEFLAAKLRTGRAGSNTATDHIEVLTDAIAQVPATHRRDLLIRSDGAGASHDLLDWLTEQGQIRGRSLEYSIGFAITEKIRDAIKLVPKKVWTCAADADGGVREGGDVAELTGLLNLEKWPAGMRVIVRRERPHPGAQLSLFEEADGWRYQAFVTNTTTGQLAFLEARHRVEFFPDVHRILEHLAERYILGVITNGNAEVARLGLADYFRFAISAEQMGIGKPDPKPFHSALQRAGVEAPQAAHIGDHPGDDIAGAKAAGLRAIWFNPQGKDWQGEAAPDAQIRRLAELPALLAGWTAGR